MMTGLGKKILIIVENLSVPFDRRVWAESLALVEAGYGVSVICPRRPGEQLHEVLEGVSIYRYPAPREAKGPLGYLWEYSYSLFAALWLSLKVRRREGFDVIQACNPPDILFVIGLFHKLFGRRKFVFDHHDLSPELFALRYDQKRRSLVYRLLLWLERCSFRTSSVVISTNESYKEIAVKRGGKDPACVFVVRNGPNSKFQPVGPNPALKRGRDHLVCYVGVMADQDGVDLLLEAISHVVHVRQRDDIAFTVIGSGDALGGLKTQAQKLDIADHVVFTGRISDADLVENLSTADVCVVPDPYNYFNDKCTFIKIAEYMAMGKPVVSFDLTESRFTAQDAAVYVSDNDTAEFGNKIVGLIDDPGRCQQMGEFGKKRVDAALSWVYGKANLLRAYEALFTGSGKADRRSEQTTNGE